MQRLWVTRVNQPAARSGSISAYELSLSRTYFLPSRRQRWSSSRSTPTPSLSYVTFTASQSTPLETRAFMVTGLLRMVVPTSSSGT